MRQPALAAQELEKFQAINSPMMPEYITCWLDALRAVNTNSPPQNLHARDKAYFFPEPSILCTATAERTAKYFPAWIALREAFIFRAFSGESSAPLLSREWRDLLYGLVFHRSATKTKAQEDREQTKALLGATVGAVAQALYNSPPNNTLPNVHEARTILWELAELNFRFELLSLDRRASGSYTDRLYLVLQCFPGGVEGISSLLSVSAKDGITGWAASNIGDRKPYIMALYKLIRDWRVACHFELEVRRNRAIDSDDELAMLESLLVKAYTQTFFNFFGRAPVVPMRLSPS
jgi:hypothetical protein